MQRRRFMLGSAGEAQVSGREGAPTRGHAVRNGRGTPLPAGAVSLEHYNGDWGDEQVFHLLRRCLFGAKPEELRSFRSMDMDTAIDKLLTLQVKHFAPVYYVGPSQNQHWDTEPYAVGREGQRADSLAGWWISLMLYKTATITEKMVFFWHNHFANQSAAVQDSRYMYKQNDYFRKNALGNLKDMAFEMSTDPAMLRFLNGNVNTKDAPNENYARELQELFTIGKGPEVEAGNYTTYTEDDVKAAARVLTGWKDDPDTVGSSFVDFDHDASDKRFSAAYGRRLIRGRVGREGAEQELRELIDMIFEQDHTARYFCRKLYRFFLHYHIDETIESAIIEPMAAILRNPPAPYKPYDVRPALEALLKSKHFYNPELMACMIKSPLEFVLGILRTCNVHLPTQGDAGQFYAWMGIRDTMRIEGLSILNPPNVAGYPQYWSAPLFHKLWLSSETLTNRLQFASDLCSNGVTVPAGRDMILMDATNFVRDLSRKGLLQKPEHPNELIEAFGRVLLATPLSEERRNFIKGTYLVSTDDGSADYEWTALWQKLEDGSALPAEVQTVETALRRALRYMFQMPEFQLC